MNKHFNHTVASIGTAAIGTIFFAGAALASQPVPNDGGPGSAGTMSQATRVRADLQDLSAQRQTVPSRGPTDLPSPGGLPYLQVGLGLAGAAAIGAGAAGMRRRHHHKAQPA